MVETTIDLDDWDRAVQFRLFRTYERPHFATTSRLSVDNVIRNLKPAGVSPYRACLYAIGMAIHKVPAMRLRFRGDQVVRHDAVEMSATVPQHAGGFGYSYIAFDPDFHTFDRAAAAEIEAVAKGASKPNTGERDDLVYLSCMPWLDYTSINNAMADRNDCIPRVSWGKFVQDADGVWRMAMTLEVHHALLDGEHVGAFFETVQTMLDGLSAKLRSKPLPH